MNLLRIAARVANPLTAQVEEVGGDTMTLEYANSPNGPWEPIHPAHAKQLISKHQYRWVDDEEPNGILCYLKKDGVVLQVSNTEAVHGEDSMSKYQLEVCQSVDQPDPLPQWAQELDLEVSDDDDLLLTLTSL